MPAPMTGNRNGLRKARRYFDVDGLTVVAAIVMVYFVVTAALIAAV